MTNKPGDLVQPIGDDFTDRLIIQCRAYAASKPKPPRRKRPIWDSRITVTFDTETATDPSQRLRFGAYQVRDRGTLIERGLFYAEDISAPDLEVLKTVIAEETCSEDGELIRLLSRAEFVEEIIYQWGLDAAGLIVGFNLPFDLSRIALFHTYAKGAMRGGFSFELAPKRPNLRVKHLSQRAAFISFAGRNGSDRNPNRGFFLDVKTLAAALTSRSHSLESLAKFLGTTPKSKAKLTGPLTPEFVRYGMNDVQVTWECFANLSEKYASYELSTPVHDLYSEASLGKAFLEQMNVRPWREVQPDFPPEILGQIMSSYFGGRAEVHIRRQITPVIHCDFLSMYPTVCTLMQLWKFVIAKGVTWTDVTSKIQDFVDRCTLADLAKPETWLKLGAIVQISPDRDILPVRASYARDQAATIGLNHLSHDEPMWFTLADVLVAKLLGGKTPKVLSALRFAPLDVQGELRPINLEGTKIDPAIDDFYKLLIDHRRVIQAEEKIAPEAQKPALKAAQQSVKILANSTSYGIFVELNVQRHDSARKVKIYDHRGIGREVESHAVEDPGRYFHPFVAAMITGGARLMLALAERNAIDQGLSWAFCDTDSLAIANLNGMQTSEFVRRVEAVRSYFEPLNPYAEKGSILQLEKVNYPTEGPDKQNVRPVNCLAISAKRYVLFDRESNGSTTIRKASAHGLGHLIPPYREEEYTRRIERIGVELWQEDLWRRIIEAHDRGLPDEVDFQGFTNFDEPAASRYAATNQTLLKWFARYNENIEPSERIRPFNFLLVFQAKSRLEMQVADPGALMLPIWKGRGPSPASRYSSDLISDRPEVFDRITGEPIPWHWLKSYRRVLVRHHLHSETKFLGGEDSQAGVLQRRHIKAWAVIPIGKEADNLDEREVLGEEDDAILWSISGLSRTHIVKEIAEIQADFKISDRKLCKAAGVSHHTLGDLRAGRRITELSLLNLAGAVEELRKEALAAANEREIALQEIKTLVDEVGSVAKLADRLGVSRQFLGRVLRGAKPVPNELIYRLRGHGA